MMQKLKPYPTYKDSGVEWLGEVPEHWSFRRGKTLFRKMQRPTSDDHEVVTCFRDGMVTLRKNRRVSGFTEALKELGYQGILRGDLVIHAMDAFAGAIGVSDSDGKGSPVYSVCMPQEGSNSKYYAYLIREMARSQWILALAKGIRERSTDFRFEAFGSQLLPLPEFPEQSAIVRYLDYMDRRIQRYNRAKQKLITLLEEQKQAIIHQAVTGRIDVRTGKPYPAYKPSGVEWLGDVPEHWAVRRLRHLIKGRLTYGANAAAEFSNSDWPRYIRITDFRIDGSLKPDTFRSLPPAIASDYIVDPGDILLARSGATVGKAFLVHRLTGTACHAGYLIRARPDRSLVLPEYLFAFSQSKAYSAWKDSTFNTATIQNIGADKYANLTIPLPSLDEQQVILNTLAREQGPLLVAFSRLERDSSLLREYRTRLVSDVVTGKLDVREAAEHLPDDLEELGLSMDEDNELADEQMEEEEGCLEVEE